MARADLDATGKEYLISDPQLAISRPTLYLRLPAMIVARYAVHQKRMRAQKGGCVLWILVYPMIWSSLSEDCHIFTLRIKGWSVASYLLLYYSINERSCINNSRGGRCLSLLISYFLPYHCASCAMHMRVRRPAAPCGLDSTYINR